MITLKEYLDKDKIRGSDVQSVLINVLVYRGFSVPCAYDMADYLVKCLARPDITTIAEHRKDIDDVIAALEELKKRTF